MSGQRLGISGRVAQYFLTNQLTPLLALAGMLLGLFAVLVTPREEEPQIDVTMANVLIPFPGASASEVESLIAEPMEQVLAEISDVKHLYSVSRPGIAVLTVEYKVGVSRNEAIVRLYNAVYSNLDMRPANLGWMQPIIKPKGIDDVPVVTVTLWSRDPARGAYELSKVAHAVEGELKRVRGARNVYTIGGPDDTVHVELDPQRLAAHGLTGIELAQRLEAANVVRHAGSLVGGGAETPVQAGRFLAGREDVAGLVIGLTDGRPVFLEDVARVSEGPDQPEQYVWMGAGPAAPSVGLDLEGEAPAVTVALSKQPGTNAVDVARRVVGQLESLRGVVIPEGVEATVTRNYGETANDKAQKLIQKLAFATASVVLLVLLALGWREAIVVGAAVVVTLAATLFASWAWGFTLNRVSLFALIFSIGILVDDAIVVVENIHRHMALGGRKLLEAIPLAVDEVGGPTILATFTVIAALLPMAFVTGLMGPYMSPIPINASLGMLISLAVAFIFTPWLSNRMMSSVKFDHHGGGKAALEPFFERVMSPFLIAPGARRNRNLLYGLTLLAILAAVSLVGLKWVVLKMLPFDNKSEFQVVVNMPEGTPVEQTAQVLAELADEVRKVPEVSDYQAYAGTAAPINFNGLVRQYYLRESGELGDLQVNLVDKHHRERQSHEIATALRPALAQIGKRHGASVQVVEVPPGPPVMAPVFAEIYGPGYESQRDLAREVRRIFDTTPDIIDVDDSLESDAERLVITVDRQKAAMLGVPQQAVAETLAMATGGMDATFVRAGREKYPIPVRVELPVAEKGSLDRVLALRVRTMAGDLVPLSEITRVERTAGTR